MKNKKKILFYFWVLSFYLIKSQPCQPETIENLVLYKCQNCSLVTSDLFCNSNQNNCANQYFSSIQDKCFNYCEEKKIALDENSCKQNTYSCIDGYQWSLSDSKCIANQNCQENLYDVELSIWQCLNCSLARSSDDCKIINLCQGQQIYDSKCYTYCGNGWIAEIGQSCESSQLCLKGLFWSNNDKKCKKSCAFTIFDQEFGLKKCECNNFIYTLDPSECIKDVCSAGQFYYNKNCYQYCGNGLIQNLNKFCSDSEQCLEGFRWNKNSKSCQKCGFQSLTQFEDSNLGLYLCPNCSLAVSRNQCKQCQENRIYDQDASQCIFYCGNGLVNSFSCSFANDSDKFCLKGFQINSTPLKCQKCQFSLIDVHFNLFQCSNCSTASNFQSCQNECENNQYYSNQLNKCMVYFENGRISVDLVNQQSSTECIDGFEWKDQTCVKKSQLVTCIPKLTKENVFICSNCSLATNSLFCQNNCDSSQYYSKQSDKCMVYCGDRIISLDVQNCYLSTLCIDGFSWNTETQQCDSIQQATCVPGQLDSFVMTCSNCSQVTDPQFCENECLSPEKSYYYKQQNKCMTYCQNKKIAQDQSQCQDSTLCIDGSSWNSQKKVCEKICTNLVPDSFVQRCPNCSLVTDLSFCENECLSPEKSYYYKQQNKCMTYCQNNKIAQDQSQCQDSTLCIDGSSWNSQKKVCEKICTNLVPDSFVQRCPNCSLVTDLSFCENSCLSSDSSFYHKSDNKCKTYCINKIIAPNQESCTSSNLCLDGYQWFSKEKICGKACSKIIADSFVIQCSNCSLVTNDKDCENSCFNKDLPFYYKQQNKCMAYCNNKKIAQDYESCSTNTQCIQGYIKVQSQCLFDCGYGLLAQDQYSCQSESESKSDQKILFIIFSVISFILIIVVVLFIKNRKELNQKIAKERANSLLMFYLILKTLQKKKEKERQITEQQDEINYLKRTINTKNNIDINKIQANLNQMNQFQGSKLDLYSKDSIDNLSQPNIDNLN